MKTLSLCVFWILSVYAGQVKSAKILCLSHQFYSHMNMVHRTAEGLLTKGHSVYTVFSDRMAVPHGLQEKGFRIITYHTPEWSEIFGSAKQKESYLKQALGQAPGDLRAESLEANRECYDMDNDTIFMKMLEDQHFDIIISDSFPLCSCLLFIPLRLKVPFLLVTPVTMIETTRTPSLPSFVPVLYYEFSDNMTFTQRLKNTLATFVASSFYLSPFGAMRDMTLLEKYNEDPKISTWIELSRRASLWMIHRGPALEYIFPQMPHIINIECLTCEAGKPLSKDIARIVDRAKGVIVVSFGSIIDTLPDEVVSKFIEAFESRNETVFFRYSADLPRSVKENIIVRKWLPQNDLLAHPKTKLFISHGGNNGQYESAYHGVPLLTFPLFADQHHNAMRIVQKGLGLSAKLGSFTSNELQQKIRELLDNPSYRNNVQRVSALLGSAPLTAKEKSVYWIEHVLEFGSDHLRSHALEMSAVSYYMLDLLLFVEVAIVLTFLVLFFFIRSVFESCKRKKNVKKMSNDIK